MDYNDDFFLFDNSSGSMSIFGSTTLSYFETSTSQVRVVFKHLQH